jgi:hypothetical protein
MLCLVFHCSDVISCFKPTGHYVRDNNSVLLNMAHRSFSAEFDSVEINSQIQGILVYGADQDPGPSPVP